VTDDVHRFIAYSRAEVLDLMVDHDRLACHEDHCRHGETLSTCRPAAPHVGVP